jgi:hypothetical protein
MEPEPAQAVKAVAAKPDDPKATDSRTGREVTSGPARSAKRDTEAALEPDEKTVEQKIAILERGLANRYLPIQQRTRAEAALKALRAMQAQKLMLEPAPVKTKPVEAPKPSGKVVELWTPEGERRIPVSELGTDAETSECVGAESYGEIRPTAGATGAQRIPTGRVPPVSASDANGGTKSETGRKDRPGNKHGRVKGAVELLEDGRAILHLYESADVSTLLHEGAHVMRRWLPQSDLKVLEDWLEVRNGLWTNKEEELLARAYERYWYDGQAPLPELEMRFAEVKAQMREIYPSLSGSPINIKIPDDVRHVFDKMAGADPLENAKVNVRTSEPIEQTARATQCEPVIPSRGGEEQEGQSVGKEVLAREEPDRTEERLMILCGFKTREELWAFLNRPDLPPEQLRTEPPYEDYDLVFEEAQQEEAEARSHMQLSQNGPQSSETTVTVSDPRPARRTSLLATLVPYTSIWACIAVLLLSACFRWPYAFYVLLRLLTCGTSVYWAVEAHKRKSLLWTWLLGANALLFNPILPVRMSRADWSIVNVASALLLVVWGVSSIVKSRKQSRVIPGIPDASIAPRAPTLEKTVSDVKTASKPIQLWTPDGKLTPDGEILKARTTEEKKRTAAASAAENAPAAAESEKAADPETSRIRKERPDLVGIGGWLLLFCIVSTIVIPLGALSTAPSGVRISPVGLILVLCFVALSLFAGISVWCQSSKALFYTKVFLIAVFCWGVMCLLGAAIIEVRMEMASTPTAAIESEGLAGGFRPFFWSLLWFAYFKRSKRVRATFGRNI